MIVRALAYMSVAALVGSTLSARARADDAIDAWAAWAMTPKVWKGQIVLAPELAPRPSANDPTLDSIEFPLRVHVPAHKRRLGAAALAALEHAYVAARGFGWPLPAPDADLGGSPAFDLYLLPGAALGSDAHVDQERAVSDFDAALTFASVSAERSGAQLAACVESAFAQATAVALEPAEARSVARASGEYAAFRETGEPGCDDSFVLGQSAPEHSLLGADLAAAGSGGMFLAMLSERHAAGSGELVRAVWELARQHSKGLVADDRLRGSPDFWEVLARVLDATEEKWPDEFTEFAAARFFAGEPTRRRAASYRVFAELPSDAAVPLLADLAAAELPRHVRTAADGGIESLASSYVRVKLPDAASGELRVWLRGELGPNWSLTALRLAADGSELGRTHAPARDVPEGYLPLAFSSDTREVILVVTNLPRTTPDADPGVPAPRGVELVLELH
jgi:hypothetical protein